MKVLSSECTVRLVRKIRSPVEPTRHSDTLVMVSMTRPRKSMTTSGGIDWPVEHGDFCKGWYVSTEIDIVDDTSPNAD